MELIAQGAEAKLFRDKNKIIKERISKEYRLPHLDVSLRKFRTRREAKVLTKLETLNFPAPKVHNFCDKRMTITMDFVNGEKVRDILDENKENFELLAKNIGQGIAKLHTENIIHGDLTTSNIMQEINDMKKDQENRFISLKFIDFGLSSFSDKIEDKAVDLFLLDRAFESKHFDLYPKIFEDTIKAYKENYPEAQAVLERLSAVQKRGRHKNK
jgi:Kae1-associated kinase Bud32